MVDVPTIMTPFQVWQAVIKIQQQKGAVWGLEKKQVFFQVE